MGLLRWLKRLFGHKVEAKAEPSASISYQYGDSKPEPTEDQAFVNWAKDNLAIAEKQEPVKEPSLCPPPRRIESEFLRGLEIPRHASGRRPLNEYSGPGMQRLANRSRKTRAFQARSGFDFKKKIEEDEDN